MYYEYERFDFNQNLDNIDNIQGDYTLDNAKITCSENQDCESFVRINSIDSNIPTATWFKRIHNNGQSLTSWVRANVYSKVRLPLPPTAPV